MDASTTLICHQMARSPLGGLWALMAGACECLSASPVAVTHTSPHTPPTWMTGAIFSRPAEISISAWMNLRAKHC